MDAIIFISDEEYNLQYAPQAGVQTLEQTIEGD
jgi:hypothetical protein